MAAETTAEPARVADPRSDIIDIRFLLGVWLRLSWVLVILALLGAAKGVMDVRALTPVYTATMTVMPDTSGGAGSGQASGVLGSLGLQIGSNAPTTFDRMRVLVKSLQLAEVLQQKHGLLQVMYRGSWDEREGRWIQPSDEELSRQQRVAAFLGQAQPWREPNLETLALAVGGAVTFKKVKETSFFEVSVSHPDPQAGLNLLKLAYFETDELLRAQDRVESQQRRRYLEAQLAGVTNIDVRQSLIGLLQQEQRRAMMLDSGLPYAARVLDPPFVSQYPETRNLKILIVLPAVIAVLAGLLVITAVALFRKE